MAYGERDKRGNNGDSQLGIEIAALEPAAGVLSMPADPVVSPQTIVLDAAGTAELVVPGGSFLLFADYVREGADLLLVGADGRQVLIRDFFAGEFPPDLISDTGLRIAADLASRLAGSQAPGEVAQAQDDAEPQAQPIGRVETIEGAVTASRVDGTTVTLEAGSPIFEGDVLETGGGAAVGIVFVDDSVFSLDEDARMVIDELVFDPNSEEGTSGLSVVQGVFSFVSGKIASSGENNMVITTPVATIGVRGTAGAGVAAPEGTLNTITLLSEEGGIVGEISITNSTGTVVLNVANASISVESFFVSPGEPVVLSNEQVGQLFGQALNNLPPPPGGGGVDVDAVDPGQGTGNQPPQGGDGDDQGDDADGDDAGGGDGAPGDGDGEGGGDGDGAGGDGDDGGEGDGTDGDGDGQPGDGQQQAGDGGGDGPGGDGGGGDFFGGDEGGDGGGDFLIGGTGPDGGGGGDFLDFGDGGGGGDPFGPGDGPGDGPNEGPTVPPPVDLPFVDVFDVSISETDGIATFTIFRSGNLNINSVVDFSTFDGTALAGVDYVSVDGSAFFNPGTTQLSVLVPLLDDADLEATGETFSLGIIGADNAEFDGFSTGTATFGAEAGFSIDDVAVNENAGTATFTVLRTGSVGVAATVDFTTVDGTASAGSDYTATSGTLSFAAGITTQTVVVSLLDDEITESPEFFTVDLANPTNAEVVDDTGIATITDDDPSGAATLSLSNAAGSENPGAAIFTVTRGGETGTTVTVQFATSDLTAEAGKDYTATSGTLTFNPGETSKTISVPVLADNLFEGLERFSLSLSNPIGATISGSTAQPGTIADNIGASDGNEELSVETINGFVINAANEGNKAGTSVAFLGDFDGDGNGDFAIGSPASAGANGRVDIVFGGATNLAALDAADGSTDRTLNLSQLGSGSGLTINGINEGSNVGASMVGLGNVGGDAKADVLIGSKTSGTGHAYLVFGASGGGSLNVTDLDGTNGFDFVGRSVADRTGFAVASIGDINGDGINDFAIGAPYSDVGITDRGTTFVVFGGATNLASLDAEDTTGGADGAIRLTELSLDGTGAFEILGEAARDHAGAAIAAGDVNDDTRVDLLIGAPAFTQSVTPVGKAYLVFGTTSFGDINLSDLNASTGVEFVGEADNDRAGAAVALGDINGDGIDDIIIGAYGHDTGGTNAGRVYVIFGNQALGASVNLSDVGGTVSGFKIDGFLNQGKLGFALSAGVDVNGDGLEDLVVGAPYNGPETNPGSSFVLFGDTGIGSGGSFALTTLNGLNGFQTAGLSTYGGYGASVAGGADVTGDSSGNPDILIGAPNVTTNDGTAYLIAGGTGVGGNPEPDVSLSTLDGGIGFRIDGQTTGDEFGKLVSLAGDVNGDGFMDFLIGAEDADPNGSSSGSSYLVLGKSTDFSAIQTITDLANGTSGFQFNGAVAGDLAARVGHAGDFNGDGFGDVLVGAFNAISDKGSTYLLLGSASGLASGDLATSSLIDGTAGFQFDGSLAGGKAGFSVGAGDLNGDGYDDIIVGAPNATNNDGATYVVFGGNTTLSATNNLEILDDGSAGFRLLGSNGERSGFAVDSGDFNGDGFDDLLIGGIYAANTGTDSGSVYLIFGKETGFASQINLITSATNGTNGFRFDGVAASDLAGRALAVAGDVNGDGFDDFIIGAKENDTGVSNGGSAYVVFGGATNLQTLDAADGSGNGLALLSKLDGTTGFRITGTATTNERLGQDVSGAGDINGDGFDDLIVGNNYGEAFVIFGGSNIGGSGVFDKTTVSNGSGGFFFEEGSFFDKVGHNVSAAGDINGDGFDDLLIGAYNGDGVAGGFSDNRGETYVFFGADFSATINFQGTSGADNLVGGAGAEEFVGGLGNDTMTGNGGLDSFRGGAGNDLIQVIDDGGFKRVDGGAGVDTLAFTGVDTSIDPVAKVTSIEKVDITGSGDNALTLNFQDVVQLSESTNDLFILGNAGDSVLLNTSVEATTTNVVIDGTSFVKYTVTGSAGQLFVEDDVTVSNFFPPP